MRLLSDTNIAAPAVQALRQAGHDVVCSGDRERDPGDSELLALAASDNRVLVTKDHDIGALVYKEGRMHAGVLLIDDLGDPQAKTRLLLDLLRNHANELGNGVFLRADAGGRVRIGPTQLRHTLWSAFIRAI